jgi:hypothetical protein
MRYLLIRYIAVLALLPPVLFVGAFMLLCAIECTSLPWLTFPATPSLALAIVVPLAVNTHRRAEALADVPRRIVRGVVFTSVLWAPLVAILMFRQLSLLQQHYPWLLPS